MVVKVDQKFLMIKTSELNIKIYLPRKELQPARRMEETENQLGLRLKDLFIYRVQQNLSKILQL